MARPFRFGVQAGRSESGAAWKALARKVEGLGYDTLAIPDHFGGQFAPFPALLAAAEATERLRVGTLVVCNDFVHPAVLARDAATVDLLTDGRLELGLGAGWMPSDYAQTGIPMEAPGVRIDRLAEGIAVLKGLFADEPFAFQGHHYRIEGMDGQPKPVQRPHPPLLVGGGGQRVLTLAGREADIVGINLNLAAAARDATDLGAEATRRKIDWVAAAAGDRFDDLEINVLVYAVVVTDDRRAVAEGLASQFGIGGDEVLGIPHFLVGTADQIADDLVERRERYGMSYVTIQSGMSAFAPVVERLAGT